MIVITMVVAVAIFYFGLILGIRINKCSSIEPDLKRAKENIPFTKENGAKKEREREIEMFNLKIQNIENYSGNSDNQIKAKRG